MAKAHAIEDENMVELPKQRPKLVAKKDFVIHQNEVHIEIKKGDDVSDVPSRFHANLKTEEVI